MINKTIIITTIILFFSSGYLIKNYIYNTVLPKKEKILLIKINEEIKLLNENYNKKLYIDAQQSSSYLIKMHKDKLEDKIIDTEMNFNIEDKFNKEFVREFRPLEITTIIDNLISNAEKADSTLINLSFKKKKENIEFIFQDNGNGISKADLEKVFEMGYTTTNGSGIGLFQVNDLIENSLNGSIEIESEEKKGTAIKITFK